MADQTLPRDAFSEALRSFDKNQGASRAETTINLSDFLGRNVTWVVITFRHDGKDTVLLQRIDATGQALREVLPPEVTDALQRHRSSATKQNRRRGARQAVATKLAAGQTIGNAAALRAARGKPRKRKSRRTRKARAGQTT